MTENTPTTFNAAGLAQTIQQTAAAPMPADEYTAQIWEAVERTRIPHDAPIILPEYLFDWCGKGFMARRNLISLKASSGTGKTFILTAFARAFLSGTYQGLISNADESEALLFVDAEQGLSDTILTSKRISPGLDCDPRINIHHVKFEPNADRLPIIEAAAEKTRPGLIIVDGIADLIVGMDYNNAEAADDVTARLAKLADAHNAVVICVIHTNKGNNDATGWLGKILQQKCDMEIFLEKENSGRRTLTITKARHLEITPIPFEIQQTDDGLGRVRIISTAEAQRAAREKQRAEYREKLKSYGITPTTIPRPKLNELIRETRTQQEGKSPTANSVNGFITRCINCGALRFYEDKQSDREDKAMLVFDAD